MIEESSSDFSSDSDSESESESEDEGGDDEQQEKKKGKKGLKSGKKKFRCRYLFRLKFYQQFFQIETIDVLKRMFWSIFPFGENFIKRISPNQDFYGPFWITTTVIFVLTLVSNCVKWGAYSSENAESEYSYDWTKVGQNYEHFFSFFIFVFHFHFHFHFIIMLIVYLSINIHNLNFISLHKLLSPINVISFSSS